MHQTVNTNMEELVNEIKDYDSKRKSEYSEMKKQESFFGSLDGPEQNKT